MLIRLFSETELLNTVSFKQGINIILGRYSSNEKNKDINGIGKSSLVRLIDFLLLSNSAEEKFLQQKYNFLRLENHNVILEFKQNGITYFIKRTFSKDDDIFFGNFQNKLDCYTKNEFKKILTNIFFPFQDNKVFFEGERYGTLMDFFIKDDLDAQKRIDPLNFSAGTNNQIDKSIFNFFLYDLPTKKLYEFDKLVKKQKDLSKTVKGLKDNVESNNGKSIGELRSEQIKIEKNIELLENSLNNYTFLERYKDIEKELIEITKKINVNLNDYHDLNRKLNKIKESFQYSKNIDTKEIQKLYNEVYSTFGDLVSKTLEEMISFKSEIFENRNKFLIKKEQELQEAINNILNEISVLEQTRSKLYKKLDEKGALDSITNACEQLILDKTKLAENLKILKEIDNIEEKIGNQRVSISEVKNALLADLREYADTIERLRKLFVEILQNAIVIENDNSDGYFDISLTPNSSPYQQPFNISVEIPKADALGLSRLKIVAYDLMVFLHNINLCRTIPYFIIHDGVFHGISIATTIKTLNFINNQFLKNPCFQYITTFNEFEIDVSDSKKDLYGDFNFMLDDVIVAKYTENHNEMIFKRNFK
ncbi:MAG: DUF2326 domain-containing protein [Firmicutes bacterium]|nr:DUF2326 domain-containing protein [Bacillota bacterium]